jgi:hypothetical protein
MMLKEGKVEESLLVIGKQSPYKSSGCLGEKVRAKL